MKMYEVSNRKGIDPAKKFEGLSFAYWYESRLLLEYLNNCTLAPEQKSNYKMLKRVLRLLHQAEKNRAKVERMKEGNKKGGHSFLVSSAMCFWKLNRITRAVEALNINL